MNELLNYVILNYVILNYGKLHYFKYRNYINNGHKNAFNIDINFYKLCNNLQKLSFNETLIHLHDKGIEQGLIYHPKQIQNIMGLQSNVIYIHDNVSTASDIRQEKHRFLDPLLDNPSTLSDHTCKIIINKQIYNLPYFLNNKILNRTYQDCIQDIIYIKEAINSIEFDTLFCCYIGHISKGKELIKKILSLNTKQLILFVINFKINPNEFPEITTHFTNYILFTTKEFGNDIIPSLQAINYALNKFDIEYVYKLHTKSDAKAFNDCIDYLLSRDKNDLVKQLYNKSNCVSHPEYYLNLKSDAFNSKLIYKYKDYIDLSKKFVIATNFFCSSDNIKKILLFVEKNESMAYFNNNLYDNNFILFSNSPIHFLERLFGVIK